jgi:hypothetical protein
VGDVMCGQYQVIATSIIVGKGEAVSAPKYSLKLPQPDQ